ncbi:MAG: hypothetical protein C4339_05720 [Nitrososphaerota archaeon]
MSWVQALEVGLALGAGLGLGLLLARRGLIKPAPERAAPPRAPLQPPDSLEKAKQEARLLSLEKENLASIIAGFYEAEARGEITPEERRALVAKYEKQFQAVNSRLGELSLYIEVGELERLREELLGLLKSKLEQIEERLKELRRRMPPAKPAAEAPAPEERAAPKAVAPQQRGAEEPSVEGRVRKIREEVLKALEKLEQVEQAG